MSKTRFKLATPERYAEGVERELAAIAKLEADVGQDSDFGVPEALMISSIISDAKAQLAQVAATIRQAEAQETTNAILAQIGELFSLHPVLSHVGATRGLIADQNGQLAQRDDRIRELELALEAAQNPQEATDGPRHN